MSTENTHFGSEYIEKALLGAKSIFFIGIGGINMSSLALISKKRGYRVGGSDRAKTAITEALECEGIEVFYSHARENVKKFDAVVYTVAISPDNPEYAYAKENGLPCFSRADYLGYIMMGYTRRIGISGMHGKSTTTSMCAEVLIKGGACPTVLSGAELPIMGGAYTIGGEENFLFEACEYMDSFLDFNPTVAVVLNIEMDHVDYFKSMEHIRSSYGKFAAITGREGYAVYNGDDSEVLLALSRYEGNRISFGIDGDDLNIYARNIKESKGRYSFDVYAYGEYFCHIDMLVTGYHNIYNALATVAVARLCGMTGESIELSLSEFCGASRRMEYKGSVNSCPVYDDYGHHPTEVKATLSGARGLCGEGGRLFCVFQPHTYSRTRALFDDFVSALSVADRVIVTKIYAARETDTLSVSSSLLANKIGNKAVSAESHKDCAALLMRELCEGDVAVIMGAGDIYKIYGHLNFDGE